MKKILFLHILLFLFFTRHAVSQQFFVQLLLPPVMPALAEEWEQNPALVRVSFTNNTDSTIRVRCSGILTDLNRNAVVSQIKDNDQRMPLLEIPARQQRIFFGRDVINTAAVEVNDYYKNIVGRTGMIPEGNYKYCVRFTDEHGVLLTLTGNLCSEFEIIIREPVTLLSPNEGDTLYYEMPQFMWTPVTNIREAVNYKLSIKPVFEGQSPKEAIERNSSLTEKSLYTTFYQYLPSDLSFNLYPNVNKYAWRVRAVNSNDEPVTQNSGYSEPSYFVLAANPKKPACECKLDKLSGPDAVCVGDNIKFWCDYSGKGLGAISLGAEILDDNGKSAALVDNRGKAKPNPRAPINRTCSISSMSYSIEGFIMTPGKYTVKFTVAGVCNAELSKDFYVIKLNALEGPAKLFKKKTEKSVDGEWKAKLAPEDAAIPDKLITWEIKVVSGGKLPGTAKGTGTAAKVSFENTGKYKIIFNCGRGRIEKDFEVSEIEEASIQGPAILCFEPKNDDSKKCEELQRVNPKGQWTLTIKPELKNVKWKIEQYEKGGDGKEQLIEKAKGDGTKADFTFEKDGCYRISFLSNEGAVIISKEILVIEMDINVVVDKVLFSTEAIPEDVPIYMEKKDGDICYSMNVNVCKNFQMRFHVRNYPAVPLEFKETDVKKIEDKTHHFEGWYDNKNVDCDPLIKRDDYFKLSAEKNGQLKIIVTNPKSGDKMAVGAINLTMDNTERRLCLNIYYVEDNKGHKSSLVDMYRKDSSVANSVIRKMFDIVNTYWSQCLVCYEPKVRGILTFTLDIGDPLTVDGQNIIRNEFFKLENVKKNPELKKNNIFFVKQVDKYMGVTLIGLSKPDNPNNFTFFSNPEDGLAGVVLAHEFLHGICRLVEHPEDDCYLDKARVGYKDGLIRKEQCETARNVIDKVFPCPK